MIDQPLLWVSQGLGKFGLTLDHERGSPRASAESLTSDSSLLMSPASSTKEASNCTSLIDSDVIASMQTRTRMRISSKAPIPPALPLLHMRALPDSLSISASVIDQVSSPDPNGNAMTKSSPVSITDDDTSEDERQSSDTDHTGLSYLPYGPPKQDHFQRTDQLQRSSSFGNDSDEDDGEAETSSHSLPDGFSAGGGSRAITSSELSNDLGDHHRSTISPSEYSSRGDNAELASSSSTVAAAAAASPVAHSTIKPAQPQPDHPESPSDELPSATAPSTPANAPSLPVWTSIPTPQTSMTSDITSIDTKIKDLEDRLTEAAEVRDQENAKITRLSSDAAVLEQQMKRQQESLKGLFKQRRELNAKIKSVKDEIKDLEDELLIKNRAVNPHVEARNNAQYAINTLADEKRKQEKKLKIARYNQMLERSIPDPVLRSIGKRLEYGRELWDVPSDTNSDSDEPTDQDEQQASDFGESENYAHVSGDEGGGYSSETVRSVAKNRSAEPNQSEAEDLLGEFIDNYTNLAHKDPKDITIAEFSSMGQTFNRLNGNIKPELDDNKAAVKSEIKREPLIKTEPDTTPDAGEPTITGNIKPESPSSIKQESSPAPFADSTAGPSYPALDSLSLSDLTADMLNESYNATQYHIARIRKVLALLKGPAPSPSPAAMSTRRRLPVARGAIYSPISRNKRKRSSQSPDGDDNDDSDAELAPLTPALSPDGHISDADNDDEDEDASGAERGGSGLLRRTAAPSTLLATEQERRHYHKKKKKKKPKLQHD